jgi:hypothetical protein
VVVSPLPREWSCWYRRGQEGISFLENERILGRFGVRILTLGSGENRELERVQRQRDAGVNWAVAEAREGAGAMLRERTLSSAFSGGGPIG